MKHYYRIGDAWAQVIILLLWAFAEIIKARWLHDFYFMAGGWYIISLAIHFVISGHKFQQAYRNYAFVCIVIVILPVYSLVIWYVLAAEMYLLQYLLPALALLYTITCIAEIIHLRKRPISYIK